MQMCAILSTQTCYIACENLLEADVQTLVYRHAFHLPVDNMSEADVRNVV